MIKQEDILNGIELFNLPNEPNNYLIDGILWEQQTIMILAKEKVGKSIFALQMACALSSGESFLSEYEVSEPMNVLYIQTESNRPETIQRLRSMLAVNGVTWNPDNFNFLLSDNIALDTNKGYFALVNRIKQKGIMPRVIIIDPLYMSMIGSLNDDLCVRNICNNIRKLILLYNCAVVIVHHEHRPKYDIYHVKMDEGDNAIMGSFALKAYMNHILHLRHKKDAIRSLTCNTQRSLRVIKDMDIELISEPLHYTIIGTVDHPSYYDKIKETLENYSTPMTAEELVRSTRLSESAVRKSLGYLFKTKEITKTNPGKRPVLYTRRITS